MNRLIKVNKIQSKLREAESTDFKYLNKQVEELRHHVLYLHTAVEASIDKRIIKCILKDIKLPPQAVQEKINTYHSMRLLLSEMDFSKKLKFIEKQKIFSKKLAGNLYKLNEVRVQFAHPISYRSILLSYQTEEGQTKVYEMLDVVLTLLSEENINDRPIVSYIKEK